MSTPAHLGEIPGSGDRHNEKFGNDMKQLFVVMVMGFVMAGCSLDKDTIAVARTPPFVARIYNNAQLTSSISINNNSSLSLDIQNWMEINSSGWQTCYTTFAPAFEIRNDNMNLNFTGGSAVLNIKNPKTGEWKQFIKKVNISGIEFLKEIKTKAESSPRELTQ